MRWGDRVRLYLVAGLCCLGAGLTATISGWAVWHQPEATIPSEPPLTGRIRQLLGHRLEALPIAAIHEMGYVGTHPIPDNTWQEPTQRTFRFIVAQSAVIPIQLNRLPSGEWLLVDLDTRPAAEAWLANHPAYQRVRADETGLMVVRRRR